MSGVVVVEQLLGPERIGSIYIPPTRDEIHAKHNYIKALGERFLPYGRVLAADPESGLSPGDVVMFTVEFGSIYTGFYASRGGATFATDRKVFVFGRTSLLHKLNCTKPAVSPLDRSILATMTEPNKFTPYGTNVLLDLGALTDEVNGVLLPHSQEFHPGVATVLAVGKAVREPIQAGDRVTFTPSDQTVVNRITLPDGTKTRRVAVDYRSITAIVGQN